MITSPDILRKEVVGILNQVNEQIKEVQAEARRMGIPVKQLRDQNGVWVLNSLLMIKMQALHTLVLLQYPPGK